MRSWRSDSPAATRALGQALADELLPDRTLLLFGDLGAGKTLLVQGLAAGLGIRAEEIQSPTFTLVRHHRGARGRLAHLDLYRLTPEECAGQGFEELLAGPGVKAVEWAERLSFPVAGALALRLTVASEERREITELTAERRE